MTEKNNIKTEIFHLVYVSKATDELNINEIRNIEHISQINNHQAEVTGILMFRYDRFMQFLEGSESEVKRIFSIIQSDPRHTEIKVLREGIIPERQFSGWYMKYTPLSDIQSRSGMIYKKLFELANRAKEVLESADESMSVLLAFKQF